jgi:hypothetical protein
MKLTAYESKKPAAPESATTWPQVDLRLHHDG